MGATATIVGVATYVLKQGPIRSTTSHHCRTRLTHAVANFIDGAIGAAKFHLPLPDSSRSTRPFLALL